MNTQALSNKDIADFLTRSSSALSEANNSLDESIALGTAAIEITRDAPSVGNALKTVSMRLRGYDEETEQLSDDLKSLTGDIADLTKSAQHPMGASLFTDETRTEYKSTYQILKDISEVYDELTDKQQAELLEKMAGKRNAQVVAAILNNFEAVESSLTSMENSAGNAEKEMSVIVDSIEYKTNRLKETGVGLAQELFNRESTKNTIDFLTKVLELITSLTKSIGGLGTAMVGLMTYKGFQGMGLVDLFNSGSSILGNMKNFFVQGQLSQMSLDNGITQADVRQLRNYNAMLKSGTASTVDLTRATMRMTPAAQDMAGRIQAGTVQIKELTTVSKAAALGMNLLNAAMSMGITLIVSYGISKLTQKIYEYTHAEEIARKKQEEFIESTQQSVEQNKQERKELQSIIKEYRQYEDVATLTEEQKERLKEVQDDLIESYGAEAAGLDLVNGKYDEQIAKLDELERKKAKNNEANLRVLYENAKKSYENNDGYIWESNDLLNSTYGLANALDGLVVATPQEEKVWGVEGGMYTKRYMTFELRTVDENGNELNSQQILDELLEVQDRLNQIRLDPSMQSQAIANSRNFEDFQAKTAEMISHYREEVDAFNQAQSELAQNTLHTHKILVNGAEYYADTVPAEFFQEYKRKLIEEFSQGGDAELLQPMLDYLNKTYSDLVHMSDFDRYWTSKVTEETKKAAKEVQTEGVFDWADYAEELDSITESVNTLSSAYEKLKNGTMTAEDMIKLFKEYPNLSQYAYDTDLLAEKLQEVANQKVDPLIQSLEEMAKTIKDPVQRAQLEGLVGLLYQIANLSTGIDKTAEALDGLTVDDYIKYEEDSIQRVIDSLESEKDYQEQILENLKQQKEELEELIKEYESIPDIIGKYIDSYQIKPLKDRKSEIEEYYNTEIEKLKEENDERDKNIELQEKQAALANARKSKVRVYSETGGWTYEKDINAIEKAEKELADFQNELNIEGLEKARDQETKDIEKQIKEWEDYKDEWKKQVESIKESDEALTASKILGADWREKVNKKDVGSMSSFSSAYVAYNNKLNNQVNAEIAAQERAIKARENEINKWKGYKDEVGKLKDEIDEDNQKHLQNLEKFNTEENNAWNDRIGNMRRNVETIRALSAAANNVSLPVPGDVGVWAIMENGKVLDNAFYSSQEEAEKRRRAIAESRVRARMPGAPSSAIEAAINSLLSTLTIKKYARGGINTTTGLSWLDGTKNKSEVVFNSEQAKQLYEIVKGGNFSKMISDNIVSTFKGFLDKINPKTTSKPTTASLSISFPNAHINATDYDSFKSFMDRYTNDLLLKMQVGL